MRRGTFPLAAGAVLAGLALLAPSTVRAQEKDKFETVKFDTFDGVELKGAFWPSTKGKKGPVAILLHKVGARSKDQGWKELAEDMHKAGFAVLSFDFRGHGESTTVGKQFWTNRMNQYVKRKAGSTVPTTVSVNDFPAGYLPNLVNDITAAKRYIERRYNDSGECNCSNIVLVGAEDGATLGALWLASETKRHRVIPVGLIGQKNEKPESKDVAACVWLNMANRIGPAMPITAGLNVNPQLPGWIKEAGNTMTAKIPMAFVYGEKDTASAASALKLARIIRGPNYDPKKKVDANNELKGTVAYGVPEVKLVGARLLTDPSARVSIVTNYLVGFILDEKKAENEWEKRDNNEALYAWYFPPSRQPVQLNVKGEKHLPPVPLSYFGIR